MAEIWGMVGAAAIGVVGGAMSGRAAQKGQEKDIAASKEIAKLQAVEGRKTTAYEAELLDYYKQLDKQRNRDARGAMYDKYSLVQKPEGFTRAPLAGPKPVNPDASTPTGSASAPLPGQRTPYVVPSGPLAKPVQP